MARGHTERRPRRARGRADRTSDRTRARGAAAYIPPLRPDAQPGEALPLLSTAAHGCRGCDLYKNATRAVFGEGLEHAPVLLVGEQPGDQEDLQGKPFVGPAGRILVAALEAAGIERSQCYFTNAVKHFKWTPAPRGKRRIHSKPTPAQVRACKPWLETELALLKPRIVVILGATAALSLLGAAFRVTHHRGEVLRNTSIAPAVVPTIHPSAILRAPDSEARRQQLERFVEDLEVAAGLLAADEPKRSLKGRHETP